MTDRKHYEALIAKHRELEVALAAEMKRPLPNAWVVQRLKRRKLVVKDELAQKDLRGHSGSRQSVSRLGALPA